MVNVLQGRCIIDSDNEPNKFIIVNSFDQFTSHSLELSKLVTTYYKNLAIPDKELKRGLTVHFQQTLLNLGILGIGQPTITDADDFDFNEEDMQ